MRIIRNFFLQILYYVVLLLSVAGVGGIAYGIYQIAQLVLKHYKKLEVLTKEKNLSIIITSVVIIIACIVAEGILFKLRIYCRNNLEFDETGMNKKYNSYDKMSAKEKAVMDEQKLMDMERLLDSATIRRLTHKGSTSPDKDMENLIGLNNVKDEMKEMAARMNYERKHHKGKKEPLSTHMCFMGPPGTGKTTCARIMTGFLYQNHYIKKNQCVEVDGNFLRGGGLGDTSKKTERLILKSLGGVLFIDEAYALLNEKDGQEAIATIVKMMEDYRDGFVLILAGYDNEMKQLINSNPGIFSRIKHYMWFQNYSIQELQQIFVHMANEGNFCVDETALLRFAERMKIEQGRQNFGNARSVRNCLEKAIDKHAVNIMNHILDKSKTYMICGEDIDEMQTHTRDFSR